MSHAANKAVIQRFFEIKVVESWFDYDALGFMQQLGMELRPKG